MVERNDNIVYRGKLISVVWAVDANQKMPAKEFWEVLARKVQTKLMARFMQLADEGRIHNTNHFKKLQPTVLWEFKARVWKFHFRMLSFFYDDSTVVITSGFKKMTDRCPPSETKRALRIMAQHIENMKGRSS